LTRLKNVRREAKLRSHQLTRLNTIGKVLEVSKDDKVFVKNDEFGFTDDDDTEMGEATFEYDSTPGVAYSIFDCMSVS